MSEHEQWMNPNRPSGVSEPPPVPAPAAPPQYAANQPGYAPPPVWVAVPPAPWAADPPPRAADPPPRRSMVPVIAIAAVVLLLVCGVGATLTVVGFRKAQNHPAAAKPIPGQFNDSASPYLLPDRLDGMDPAPQDVQNYFKSTLGAALSRNIRLTAPPVVRTYQKDSGHVALLMGLPTVTATDQLTVSRYFAGLTSVPGLNLPYGTEGGTFRSATTGGTLQCVDANVDRDGTEVWLGICVNADKVGVAVLVETDLLSSQVDAVLWHLMPEFEQK